jgi:guanylate kinase
MSDYPRLPSPALFVVLSGPSGAGKSTLMRRYLELDPACVRCLSVTTRAPRTGERDGVDYFFVDEPEFARRREAGAFLEWAAVFGRHGYATPRAFVAERLAAGQSVIKDVDVQGAAAIRASFPAAVHVFVAPSAPAEIERRLRARATEAEEQIRRRLGAAEAELARWRAYDYLVVNDDLDRAAADLLAIVRAERLRIARAG